MKVALIGLGYWGPNLLRVLNNLGVISHAFDLDGSKLDKYSKLYPNITFGKDYSNIFLNKKVKAVFIATPPDTHYGIALSALAANKHVFIEKPMTLRTGEAKDLVKVAKQGGRSCIIMVGHTFLYTPEVRKIKEIVSAGELGDIQYIHASRLNLGKFQKSNVILDLAPHDISIFNYILDSKLKSVSSQGYSFIDDKVVEVAFVTFEYESGAICNLHLSWLDPLKRRTTTIVGTKKMLVYDMMAEEKIKIYDKGVEVVEDTSDYGKYMLSYRHGDIWSPHTDVWEPLSLECQHFIECIENRELPLTDGYNGIEVVKGLEAALLSLERGKKVWLSQIR